MSHETTNPGPPVLNFAIQAQAADDWARKRHRRDELYRLCNETADQLKELQAKHATLVTHFVQAERELWLHVEGMKANEKR